MAASFSFRDSSSSSSRYLSASKPDALVDLVDFAISLWIVDTEIKVSATGWGVEFDKLMNRTGIFNHISALSVHHCFIVIIWAVRRKFRRGKRKLRFSLSATIFSFHCLSSFDEALMNNRWEEKALKNNRLSLLSSVHQISTRKNYKFSNIWRVTV